MGRRCVFCLVWTELRAEIISFLPPPHQLSLFLSETLEIINCQQSDDKSDGRTPMIQMTPEFHKGWFIHRMPCPCRAAKGLEFVFPIWFTQCGRVWFTLAMPCPCHVRTMAFFPRPQHSTAVERWPCCVVTLRRTAWSEHGMGMAWQVWIRHGRTVQIK